MATTQQRFDVGGVLMPQPFKIRRLGHFGFNVYNMRECLTFYRDLLGFKVSDEARMGMDDPKVQEMLKETGADGRGYFFHYGADHHASCSSAPAYRTPSDAPGAGRTWTSTRSPGRSAPSPRW